MEERRYPIRIGGGSRPLLRLAFGVTQERAWVALTDDHVTARFGWWVFRASIEQIARWRIEGPWHWITAIGVRMSARSRELSFAGSPRGGVRMDFRTPVGWGFFRVPALYVGVDDLEGFAAELAARGIPGEDGRRSPSTGRQ
ncbi:hypothetical protein BH24CHL9_BH24CHL9_14410 [soil metagenome]